ncbi:MAG: type II secretion system F family protein [Eubacteriales bacterium]|nr:type II secretion system F family protein [Eubacteriales bacterium]
MSNLSVPQNYNIYDLNSREKIHFSIFCITILFLTGYLFYHSMIISIFFTCLALPCYRLYRAGLAEKRRRVLTEQFRDVLYSVSASIAAGRQMTEALHEAEQNIRLIYKEDDLIVMELSVIVKRLYEFRESEEEVLRDFASRTGIEDISDFVDIYLTCRETGGDLVSVLNKASEMILDKIAIEKEIHTITVQKRYEARILAAMPLIIILLLNLVSPDYLAVMYERIAGHLLMTAAFFGIGFSYIWSMKLIKIEV